MSRVLLAAQGLVVDHRREAFLGRPASSVRALDGVTLRVERGEILAVVGASGAGKSTLARALLGLERPTSGSVAWSTSQEGELADLASMRPAAVRALRPRFQPVFQDPGASLDPRRTVDAALREALRVRPRAGGREDDDVAALLARVGLSRAHAERAPHALSGGEKQRVCLARALATDPELLVLDEPVAALDASVQAQVLELLRTLRDERGLTYVLVTHDLAIVAWIADRVLVLDAGRVVEEGSPTDVLRDPRHAATRALVEARRTLEGR